MTQENIQRLELALGCVLFAMVVLRFAKKGRISFRYTTGWLVLCALGVFASLLIPIFAPVAEFLRLSPTVFLVVVASIGSLLLFLQLTVSISGTQRTVSISGTQRRVNKLAEENALLREKLERLERPNDS